MTRSSRSYKEFLALTRTEGLAKASKFEVYVMPPISKNFRAQEVDLNRVSLLAEVASLPPLNIKTERLEIYGPTHPRPTGIDYGDTITLTFYLDRSLQVRNLFEQWMAQIIDQRSYDVGYQIDYVSDELAIRKLDGKDDIVKEYIFREVFPIAIGPTQLNSGVDEYNRMDVTFAYRRWSPNFYVSSTKWNSRSIFSPLESLYEFVSDTYRAGADMISSGIGAVDNELNNIINGPQL